MKWRVGTGWTDMRVGLRLDDPVTRVVDWGMIDSPLGQAQHLVSIGQPCEYCGARWNDQDYKNVIVHDPQCAYMVQLRMLFDVEVLRG